MLRRAEHKKCFITPGPDHMPGSKESHYLRRLTCPMIMMILHFTSLSLLSNRYWDDGGMMIKGSVQ